MTKSTLHYISAAVASSGALLVIGDKIIAMPGLPGWLVNAWPLVLFAATIIDRIGSAIIDASNDPK